MNKRRLKKKYYNYNDFGNEIIIRRIVNNVRFNKV